MKCETDIVETPQRWLGIAQSWEKCSRARIVPAVLEMAKNPEAANAKARKAREFVEQRQRETMKTLARELGGVEAADWIRFAQLPFCASTKMSSVSRNLDGKISRSWLENLADVKIEIARRLRRRDVAYRPVGVCAIEVCSHFATFRRDVS